MAGSLDGRVALVTGVSGNLGPTWVEALAAAGATVMGFDVSPAGREVPRLAGFGACDVTSREDTSRAFAEAAAAHGIPDVLVNNAGVDTPPSPGGVPAGIEGVSLDDFRRVLDVNLAGTFNVSAVVGSAMAEQGRGSIVNVGSLYASIAPIPELYDHLDGFLKPPAYGASKAGLVQLTKYFARLWGPRGVRVNTLSPGGVAGGQDPEFVRKFSERVALQRMGEAGDLTGPLVFLAGDASAYVTGQELRVDGGFTA